MLINHINNLVFFQFFVAIIIWFFLLFLIDRHLIRNFTTNDSKYTFFLCYYVILSIVAIIRIFYTVLPFTPDSLMYLKAAKYINIDNNFYFIGAFIYSSFIYFIKALTFNNYYSILFLNNFIFILALIELTKVIPKNNTKSLWVWYCFLLVYPSVYWFIPNILREAIFFYFIVNVLTRSIELLNSRTTINKLFLLILFCFLSTLFRPQIFPIIFCWLVYVFFKRSFISGIVIFLFGVLLLFNDQIIAEYISKVSFEYLEAKKTQGADSIANIAFENLIIPKNIYELINLVPYLIFRFLFAPFPWELSNLKYFFATSDSIVLIILFSILFYNIIRKRLWNWDIIIFSFMFISVLGVFEIAFSGAVRHRMPYILILSVLIMSLPKTRNHNITINY